MVSATVTSQMRTRPIHHGMSFRPSGLFPSVLLRPAGSFVAGILVRTRLLQISSLRFACLADLPGPNEQDSPWEPLTIVLHRHLWDSQILLLLLLCVCVRAPEQRVFFLQPS